MPRGVESSSIVTVRCWGTRGSIPSPGPDTVRYGGNTSCLEVRHGGRRLVFDAGTGIRPLGDDLVERGPGSMDIFIFLTHFHWDHVQGFPFFAPLYDPEETITVVGPKQGDLGVQSLFAGQMRSVHFPVPFDVISATVRFEHLNGGSYEMGDVALDVIRVKHPSFVIGYRIRSGGRTICFIPDNEMRGSGHPVGDGWEERMRDFVGDADLLVHDSTYTEEEYTDRAGWGHSTFLDSVRLAEESGVKRLLFFHHAPTRSDDELDTIVGRLRDDALARGSRLAMDAAAEGREVVLAG